MKKTVIVDIDETLWNLTEPWWEELKKVHPDCPKPGSSSNWEFQEGYMTKEQCMDSVFKVHCKQDQYKPFPHASYMLEALKDFGYYIIIASHRDPRTRFWTQLWLDKYNLKHDELYLGWTKHELFDKHNVIALIDDSPATIEKALKKNIKVFAIKYPYNEHFADRAALCPNDERLLYAVCNAHFLGLL